MKRYVIYECEKCGVKSEMYDEIYECEANHIGLTSIQMKEYESLKEKVVRKSGIVGSTSNDLTRRQLDKAIDELIEFEEKHNIRS